MSEETSFYSDQQGVRVTDKRVILGNTTYALANITSVTTAVEQPSVRGPILFILIGIFLIVTSASQRSSGMAVGGVVLLLLGVVWYRGCKPRWHLKIASASGEATPLQSPNQQWITSIAQAINEAMIHHA
jgi:Family of unknown function (DUF6232)